MIFFGCGRQVDDSNVSVLARVGNISITEDAFRQALEQHPLRLGKDGMLDLLEEMITREATIQAAVREGVHEEPEARRQWENILINHYRAKRLDPLLNGIEASEQEAEDYYREHLNEFMQPEAIRLAILQMEFNVHDPDSRRDAISRLRTARAKALKLPSSQKDFGSISVEFSDHQPSRYRGGDLGWIQTERSQDHWKDYWVSIGRKLRRVGDVSDVSIRDNRVCLVKLQTLQPPTPIPFKDVRMRVRRQIRRNKLVEVEEKFAKAARSAIGVHVFTEKIEAIQSTNTVRRIGWNASTKFP